MNKLFQILALSSLVSAEALFEMNQEELARIPDAAKVVKQLLLASDVTQVKNVPQNIVVIGAGASAIKLAHTLIQKGVTSKITLLEAGPQVGGRMRKQTFVGQTVEWGANWVQGLSRTHKGKTTTNPLWTLAQQCGLQGFVDEDDDSW